MAPATFAASSPDSDDHATTRFFGSGPVGLKPLPAPGRRPAGRGHTRLGGVNLNDLKIAGRDTGQAFSLFEYTGCECGGLPPRVTLFADHGLYVVGPPLAQA